MRLVIPTTTLFTVAFLATLMSNTENANLANAKLALGLTNDDMPPKKGSENPESMEEPVTEVSLSAAENISLMEFATIPGSNKNTTQQRLAKSNSRYMDSVQEIRLEGQRRSPLFIPEFSGASPWANMAPQEIINAEPFTDNGSVASNSSLSRAMPSPIFPRTAVGKPVSHSVPEIIERPKFKAKAVIPSDGADRLPVPEPPPNSLPAIASLPYNYSFEPVSDLNSWSPVAQRAPSPLPTFSSGETTQTDRPIQGSAKDLLPIGEAESKTPPNSSRAISPSAIASRTVPKGIASLTAAVQPPDNPGQTIAQTGNNIYRPNPQDVQLIQEQVPELAENAVVEELIESSPSLPNSSRAISPSAIASRTVPKGIASLTAAVQDPDNPGQTIAQPGNNIYRPNPQNVQLIQEQVQELAENAVVEELIEGSPSLTISNPTAYGADNNTGYLSATYQQRVRNTESDDAAFALGFGFGDAQESVGMEVSYTFASLGTRRNFGTGGFNIKVHRQFADDWAVAAGWNGFIGVGDDLDGFEDSVYGVVSKVIRTKESISSPFSRIALSAGVGNGQFRSADALEDGEDGVNVFGSVAVRVAKPLSVIAEWTGQDFTVGASIAPFKNIPFVITPAVRDLAGTGDGARFVIGAGVGFRF